MAVKKNGEPTATESTAWATPELALRQTPNSNMSVKSKTFSSNPYKRT